MTISVIALPGGVMPAAPRYAPLTSAFGGEVEFHLKDLEVYSGEQPPAGYSIEMEVEAVARFAAGQGLERFHLLGYSGGGFVALAFAGTYPERLLSLALFEPASVPGPLSAEEASLRIRLREQLAPLSGVEFMRTFMALQVRPGVEVSPPAGPPPPWMRSRPGGLAAMMAAFEAYRFDRERLRECRFPVFLGYGDLTGEHEAVKASVLARLLPDLRIRRYAGIHHFVPPELVYASDHLQALRDLWMGRRLPPRPSELPITGARSSA